MVRILLILCVFISSCVKAQFMRAALIRSSASVVVPVNVLENVSGFQVVYSLRKTKSTYNKKAVLVRRASNGDTLSIGFDANGNFDGVTFENFVGGGVGYAVTLYDQEESDGVINATQSNASLQAQIIQATNNHYVLYSAVGLSYNTNNATAFSNLHRGTGTVFFFGMPGLATDPNAAYGILGNNAGASGNIGFNMLFDDRVSQTRNNAFAADITRGVGGSYVAREAQLDAAAANAYHALAMTVDATNATAGERLRSFVNASKLAATNTATNAISATTTATTAMQIGNIGSNTFPYIGYIAEVFINSGKLADSTVLAIQRNEIGYYRNVNLGQTPSDGGTATLDKTISTFGTAGRYNGWGTNIIPPGATSAFIPYRSGTTHLNQGRLEYITRNLTTGALSSPTTIITPATNKDFRCALGGVVGGEKIILATAQYDYVADTFDGLFYMLSTDLTGTSFGALTALPLPSGVVRELVYGKLIAAPEANTYYQPAYGFNTGRTESVVWLYKFVYGSGAITSVSIIEVYRGPLFLTETTFEVLGGGNYIAHARVDGRNIVMQMGSTDGGLTWSAPVDTNMGNGGTYATNSNFDCVPATIKLNGQIICVYQDRVTHFIRVAKQAYTTGIPSPTGYTITDYISNGNPGLGYPDMTPLPAFPNAALLTWVTENTTTSATIKIRNEDFNP